MLRRRKLSCAPRRYHSGMRSVTSLLVAVAMAASFGCGSVTAPTLPPSPLTPTPSPFPSGPAPKVQGQRLRLTNVGPMAARNLTVVFPDFVHVPFGDVAAGTTTEYEPVRDGVYRYAAYRLEINGEIVSQPVIDWVGEQPMEGRDFTYAIDVDATQPRYQWVRLISVMRDE